MSALPPNRRPSGAPPADSRIHPHRIARVIAIIVILAGMLLPALSKAKAKALGSKPVPITTAQLFPYTKSLALYRCPSDRSTAFGEPRVRSVAASQAFYASAQPLGATYQHFTRTTQLGKPSETWVFLDENPNTINDASLVVSMTVSGATSATVIDSPAGYHLNATSFSFADGHSEIHRWQSREFCNLLSANYTSSDPSFIADSIWLSSMTSQLK